MRSFLHAFVLACVLGAAVVPVAKATVSIELRQGTNISASVSPDGSQLVFDLHGMLWILSSNDGSAEPITNWDLEATRPVWSPKGDLIAFQAFRGGSFHVWTVRPDGSGLTQRTYGEHDDREPAWSPDGTRLAFASDRAQLGSYDIWSLDLSTGGLFRWTDSAAEEYEPAWSPDGTRLAFIEDGIAIASVDAEGARREHLRAPDRTLLGPAWLPDGSGLVHLEGGRGMDAEPGLRILRQGRELSDPGEDVFPFRPVFFSPEELLYTADGGIRIRHMRSGAVRSVPFVATELIERPAWSPRAHGFSDMQAQPVRGISRPRLSPDGSSVVFTALNDLHLVGTDGAVHRLTDDMFLERDAAWSGDGRSIHYLSDRSGRTRLYRRDLASGLESEIPIAAQVEPIGVSVSPNGERIAFFGRDDGIHVHEVATGEERRIAEGGFDAGDSISWSSDNRHIALGVKAQINKRFREGVNLIRVINTDSGQSRLVRPSPVDGLTDRTGGAGPLWSPDGRWLAFIMRAQLWALPVAPDGSPLGAARQISREAADYPSWSGDSQKLLYLNKGELKVVTLDGEGAGSFAWALEYRNAVASGIKVIHAGRFWDGVAGGYLEDVNLIVDGDRIAAIRPHGSEIPEGAVLIDASRRTVMPGLIDLHVHPGWTGVRPWRAYLAMGITSIVSMGGSSTEMVGLREAIASGRLLGPRMLTSGELIDGSRINYGGNRAVTSDEQLVLEIDRQTAAGVDFLKTYVRLPGAQMKRVGEEARRRGMPSASHFMWPGFQSGQTMTSHLAATSRTGYSPTISPGGHSYDDVVALYSQSDFRLVHTAFARSLIGDDPDLIDDSRVRNFLFPEFGEQVKSAAGSPSTAVQLNRYRAGAETLGRIQRAGGRVGLGTDSPLVPPALALHMDIRALTQQGNLDPVQTLRMATADASVVAGIDVDVGTLKPGQLADLIIIDGDPLNDINELINVEKVIVGGRLYSQEELAAGLTE